MKKSKAKEAGRSSFVPAAVTALLLLFYGGFLAHRISLHTADLGRHLKNGEVFFRTFDTISTNYYSYTWPDHPAINHHWGSGVLFHAVWIATGFIGLHLFFITLSLATFLLMFLFVRRRFGLYGTDLGEQEPVDPPAHYFGVPAVGARSAAELARALKNAFAADHPTVIEAKVDPSHYLDTVYD